MSSPDIFDRSLRSIRRDRMLADFAAHDFLYRAMLDELRSND
ncbi:MAG: SAM-dependent methyltransferase, partial [Sphingobium sp.]|nr:SAM-dependent methyltransferase [Sphingobium sp.]